MHGPGDHAAIAAQPAGRATAKSPNSEIDWGTNSIGFNGAGPTSATFRLVVPRRLVRLDAYNGGPSSSSVTLQCDAQPLLQVVVAAGQLATIATNWTVGTCSVIRLGSTNGWNTNFDNLVFDS